MLLVNYVDGVFFFNESHYVVDLQKYDGFNVVGGKGLVDNYLRILKEDNGTSIERLAHGNVISNLYVFHRKNFYSYPSSWKRRKSRLGFELIDRQLTKEGSYPKSTLGRVSIFLDMCRRRGMTPEDVIAFVKKSFITHDIPSLETLKYFSHEELFDGVDEEKAKRFFGDIIV